MPFARVTLQFDDWRQGFSESYYRDVANLELLRPFAEILRDARLKLCGSQLSMPIIRMSFLEIFRDSKVIQVPKANKYTTPTVGKQDFPTTAYNVRLEGGSLYRGRLFMRGVPDGTTTNDGTLPPTLTPAFDAAFTAFKTVLVGSPAGSGWSLFVLDKETGPLGKIASASTDNTGITTYTTQAPHGIAVGEEAKLNIIGIRGLKGVNGVKRAIGVNADQFRVLPLAAPVPLNPAGLSKLNYGEWFTWRKKLAPITEALIVDVTSRKPGRPFGSHPGRRRRATA